MFCAETCEATRLVLTQIMITAPTTRRDGVSIAVQYSIATTKTGVNAFRIWTNETVRKR